MAQQFAMANARFVGRQALPVILLCCLCMQANKALAVVTFDWAIIGNPGNAPDQVYSSNNPDNLRFGAVDYVYRIGKYEVTNTQYVEFLNAVDPMGSNLNDVYHIGGSNNIRGGIVFNAAAASGAKYATKTNMGNKPVNYVSFFDAMRFTNWLENGQPTGGSGTESGVYTIGNGVNETRAPGAIFFIPSEDEWYKAAYYQPAAQGGDTDNYWIYPTASNSVPTIATANAVGDINNPGPLVANHFQGADWNGQNGNVTTVGSAGPLSRSFYGTFDQGGNVREWNEAIMFASFRGLRGGSFYDPYTYLVPSYRNNDNLPVFEFENIGFRVASVVPEPGVNCDFNFDGGCDIGDLNALLMLGPIGPGVSAAGQEAFDLTGDGVIDNADVDQWLATAATENGFASPYFRGDANLDGFVDASDFNIWNSHRLSFSLAWDSGDFNGDGAVDASDFNIWNSHRLMSSARTPATVPEPEALWLSFIALGWLAALRRLR